jgi:hypothetical protein
MEPIHLTKQQVYEAARAAYLDGTLQCLADPKARVCLYSGPCAIGAALSVEYRKNFDNFCGNAVMTLLADGVVTTDDPNFLQKLQSAHDGSFVFGRNKVENRRQLRALLDIPEPEEQQQEG